MQKKYLIQTFGCQMNEDDSARLAGILEAEDMVPAGSLAEADVVVLNTCCIRENADNKLYGTLGHLKSMKASRPELEILVGGCLAQKDRDLIQSRAGHVDVVFGTHNLHRAAELLHEARSTGPLTEIFDAPAGDDDLFPTALASRRAVGYQSWLTIQVGCDNHCAFCIVPSVRGPEISRPFETVLDEARNLAADGVTEITLLGQNVNSYGRDLALKARANDGLDEEALLGAGWIERGRRAQSVFADLLIAVGSVPGIRRVRFTSPHPKDFRQDTVEAMASTPAVCEHLHLPLQSGSDRVLSLMHRGYDRGRFADKVQMARAAIEDLAVTTDIIVGFPGETDRDFSDTLELVAELQLDGAFTFIYSPRPGTEAASRTEDFVPHEVAVERMERLRAVVERSSIVNNRKQIGRTEEVLVLGPSKKNPAVLTGRTRHNKLVHFQAPTPIRPGSYALVRITSAAMSHLTGSLLEVTWEPTHRTRIALSVG